MIEADIITLGGYLVAVWAVGFVGGYAMTKFRDAIVHVS